MNLPVFKQLTYVSPSGFMKWSACQFKTYQTRLAGHPFMRQEQGLAAAIGNVFDAFIKDYIAKKLKLGDINLTELLEKGVDDKHKIEALKIGKNIAVHYIDLGLAKDIINYRGDVKLDRELFKIDDGIPILGQLDMILGDIPFDWKTRGFTSTYHTSPMKGWLSRVDYNTVTGKITKVGNNIYDMQPLELLNENWAIQLTFYNWLLGNNVIYNYQIDEICFNDPVINFSHHAGVISPDFVAKVRNDLNDMWDKITRTMYTAEIEEPKPSKHICESYGCLCEAAHICKQYQATLGHKERRHMYV